MYKGISMAYGFPGYYKDRFDKIKKCGFTHYMTSFGYYDQNGTLEEQVEYAESIGLKRSSIHCFPFKDSLKYFWEDCAEGDAIEKELIEEVRIGSKLGFKCLVVHTHKAEPNPIGVERFKRILKVCEECDFPIALENLDFTDCFRYVFKHIEHPYLKVCYDSGHNHAFTPNENILDEFGDKIICTHLHDNDGTDDWHTVSEFGNINWEEIGKKLAKCNIDVLDFELLNAKKYGKDEDYLLNACFNDALMVEKIVEKNR